MYCKAYIITDTVQRILQWERQKSCSNKIKSKSPWQRHNVTIDFILFFGEEKTKAKEDKRNDQT